MVFKEDAPLICPSLSVLHALVCELICVLTSAPMPHTYILLCMVFGWFMEIFEWCFMLLTNHSPRLQNIISLSGCLSRGWCPFALQAIKRPAVCIFVFFCIYCVCSVYCTDMHFLLPPSALCLTLAVYLFVC